MADIDFAESYLTEVSKRLMTCAPNAPMKIAFHFDLIAKLASHPDLSPEMSQKVSFVVIL